MGFLARAPRGLSLIGVTMMLVEPAAAQDASPPPTSSSGPGNASPSSSPPPQVSGQPAGGLDPRLRLRLETLTSRTTYVRNGLPIAQASGAVGLQRRCRDAGLVAYGSVEMTLRETREEALAIAREASGGVDSPLVEYVNDRFPAMPARERSDLARHCFRTIGVLAPARATGVFDTVLEIFRELGNMPSVRIDTIAVTSQPAHVPFVFRTRGGTGLGFENTTDTRLHNVVRGLYTISMTLDGYAPLRQEVNLVQSSAPRIECRLVRVGDPGASGCRYD